ncbi:ribosome biogenesis GTPase YlqF [Oribacterium sp. WCC10]|uniref:ribosome biogenesis GTPase YlqF n=1 Tax=Oribacterium sp. WCC10 TaxID=1855343 RepID=UPI0008E9EEFC|nr:ribosome biogenesis GTPase YlqF [Oribacterium sp. WCC10]SFG08838.1 ribosome biogenesis GTPase A [Oribacterium sp. WCC10]
MHIQWYPGHMAKAKRNIREDLKLVDLVIEVVDARCPESSRNPDVDSFAKEKSRILLLNKADLADKKETKRFASYYAKKGFYTMEIDARNKGSLKKLPSLIDEACQPLIEKNLKRGIKTPTIRAMVLGIPNVGKSTFINTYVGKAMAKTGNKPGVTRGNQWINVGKRLQLLDTPGITWPKFEREIVGLNLAMIGSINDQIINIDELVFYLLKYLVRYYPDALTNRYGETVTDDEEAIKVFDAIGKKRGCIKKGGDVDYSKTAKIILDDFRSGRLGNITLEHVPGGIDDEQDQSET